MKQKDWTDQLRDRLSDYEAAVPEGLWADIEQSLPQAKTQPLWQRWASIAAVVALLAGTGWWLWPETETPVNRRQAAQSVQPALPIQDVQPDELVLPDTKPRQLLTQVPHPTQAPIAPTPAKEQLEETTEQTDPKEKAQTGEQSKTGEQPQQLTYYPTTTAAHQPRKPVPTTTASQKNARSLSLGLYTNGGLLALNTNPDSQPRSYDSQVVAPSDFSSNSPDTILTLPSRHHVEQRQHHDRPVSFGLSVGYPLSGRWSLQSGLVYTRLHSDFANITNGLQTTQEQTLHYIGLPLSLQCALLKGRQWKLYASAGTQLDWNIRAQMEGQGVKQPVDKDRLQWSVGGAFGAEYAPIPQLSIYAEPGLRHYFDNGSPVQNFFKDQPTTWTLQLGLRLNLSFH